MREHAIQRQAASALEVATTVRDAVERGQPADQTLAGIFRANRHFGARDRRFTSQLVFSYFRWKGWVDACPDFASALTAAYHLDATERNPAADTLGSIPCVPAGTEGLHRKAAAFASWIHAPTPPPATALVPPWTESQLIDDGRPDGLLRFIASIQTRPQLWLRARLGHETEVLQALRKHGLNGHPDPRCPSAIAVPGSPALAPLEKTIAGLYEVQDLASQCVAHACAPRPGERWWDICAGAGGKTLHLADLLHDRGAITSTDVRDAALRELRRRVRRAGFTCIQSIATLPADERTWNISGPFDGILVDAPCSGLGTWGRSPDARWRTTLPSLHAQADRQVRLLTAAVSRLAPGGTLMYAVCSLAAAETVGVLQHFFAASPACEPLLVRNVLAPQASSARLALFPDLTQGIGMFIAGIKMVQ